MAFDTGINSQQLAYFRRRLILWRDELTTESTGAACNSSDDSTFSFKGQMANTTNSSTPYHSQDRKQKLIRKIDETLSQIEAGTYGMGKVF